MENPQANRFDKLEAFLEKGPADIRADLEE
jgi:hypothetical protein